MEGLDFRKVVWQPFEDVTGEQLLFRVVEQLAATVELNAVLGAVEERGVVVVVIEVVRAESNVFSEVGKDLFRGVHSVVSWEHVRLWGLQTVIWNGRAGFLLDNDILYVTVLYPEVEFVYRDNGKCDCLKCCRKYCAIHWGRIRLCVGKAWTIFECKIYLQLRS